ncbi:phosphoribosylpyrophosphate synthetase [Putridiphycobacter roseus]|uniref:Phosphoribosylpyrophosphate synthetase n=1 Tax=Putridiphycobacter roseus TaxID=2219161 RepID=A0A2W1N6D1_9FLAO|nr:phosphoribosylpyrophosphate synthetase [Putridiphycobacter roseus]PZE18681.1 phosphoribosylpyrophosphate synthetase [Putridiphycobacter roseus]
MKTFETLTAAIAQLKKEGYTTDFNIRQNGIHCKVTNILLSPKEFEIDEKYHFEDNDDPSDAVTLYAISSVNGKMKGLLVGSYGIYQDDFTQELLEKLK